MSSDKFNIAIYADDIALCSNFAQVSDFWQQLELASELQTDLRDTINQSRNWLVDFNARKTQLVLYDWSKISGAITVKMGGSFFEENPSFTMLGLSLSSKSDWATYIVCIAKTASKKTEALNHSMEFLSPEVAFYLMNLPCSLVLNTFVSMGRCSQAPRCYLGRLDKLQKRICRTVRLFYYS